VATLAKYEQLFQEKFPSTRQYVKTAQSFTQQCNALDVKGGAYLYEVVEGGNAAEGGLTVGDIIISFNGDLVYSTKAFLDSRAKIVSDGKIRLGFLRMDKTGHFERKDITLPNGPLGVQLMDI
jgi:S1-C subfamily serine protease